MLQIANLWKIYNHNEVVKNFSFEFEPGIYLLLGLNGKGKSTILKMIAGLIYPSNSNYQIDNVNYCYIPERIELVFETPLYFLELVKRLNKRKDVIIELLRKWEIPNKPINTLSKGNKQKIALLMAYLTDAYCYLFDEPTDSLDSKSIKLYKDMLEELAAKNKIIVIATHEKKYFRGLDAKEIRI